MLIKLMVAYWPAYQNYQILVNKLIKSMSSSGSSQQEELSIPKWKMKSDYVETCNFDFGCSCNFNGFPTYGFSRALILFHIQEGKLQQCETRRS